jgi:dTDP-glucose 4,6-dehydratase
MSERQLLLTGGAGFIGSQLARTLVAKGWAVRVLDRLTYAGHRAHLDGVEVELQVGDICDPAAVARAMRGCAVVVHAAAESHVARSLTDPAPFLRTNVEGTRVMLECAARLGVGRFVHISTDEVFGAAPAGTSFGVDAPHRPGNPYAASKCGAEALIHAWRHTHGLAADILRCVNNYGPRQHPEKAIPHWSLRGLAGGPVDIHGDGSAVRDWIYVEDFAEGVAAVLERGTPGATWHFAGQAHRTNLEMVRHVMSLVGQVQLVHGPDRKGQDARYALDDAATRVALDWSPRVGLDQGLAHTVAWYRQHGADWARQDVA